MKRKFIGTMMVVVSSAILADASVIYDNGVSNPSNIGANFSENNSREADDFTLASADLIRSVQFWGTHWSSGTVPVVEDFQLIVYGDSTGTPDPGNVLGASSLSLISRVDTGFDHNNLAGADILEYTMDLSAPIGLGAGTYWLSIYLATDAPGTSFAWQEAGLNGSGNHHLSSDSGSSWSSHSNALAYNISNTYAIPEPATMGLMGILSIGTWFIRRRFYV